MADLKANDKSKLERLFAMQTGYVSDFSDRSFREFIDDAVGINIDDSKYYEGSNSKARRLRMFWKLESNAVIGKLLLEMIEHVRSEDSYRWEQALGEECIQIAKRLLAGSTVSELGAIKPNRQGEGFEMLAREVRQAIQEEHFRQGLDRLHAFLTAYIRTLCQNHGINTEEKSLNAIFGEYVKTLVAKGKLQSDMSQQVMRMSITALDKLNHVRNDQSLAHPNEVLNHEEALLIFNYVTATVRFLESLEK
ncbi:MAG: abortive infection family protein [Cyanobacteria bacterium DS2.3.42]|nr:abortive infection family protein [Cyanobacteria bacterium DS2.3.42]